MWLTAVFPQITKGSRTVGRKFLCAQMQGQMGPARGWAQEVGRGVVLLSTGSGFVPKSADAVSLLCVCSQDSQALWGGGSGMCQGCALGLPALAAPLGSPHPGGSAAPGVTALLRALPWPCCSQHSSAFLSVPSCLPGTVLCCALVWLPTLPILFSDLFF